VQGVGISLRHFPSNHGMKSITSMKSMILVYIVIVMGLNKTETEL